MSDWKPDGDDRDEQFSQIVDWLSVCTDKLQGLDRHLSMHVKGQGDMIKYMNAIESALKKVCVGIDALAADLADIKQKLGSGPE
ncbi:MAG: hypothetical protein MPJ50_15760 [Pirellulales bacterium]|nr:hypothetical protein [Pirellulales bacterium]